MPLSSQQLEDEIKAMENRLASVKVTVEIEKTAWQKVAAPKGKSGAKWKGAIAKTGPVTFSRSDGDNADSRESVTAPMTWDALELAQYLKSKQLVVYAQVVVSENITGKLLLTTAPGKLRTLFDGLVARKNDPAWRAFLCVCAQLHKLQKTMDPPRANAHEDEGSGPNACGIVFPLISPHGPAVFKGSSLSIKPHRPQPPPSTASLVIGDPQPINGHRINPHATGRKAGTANHTQAMVTCWNCSARFPRAMPISLPSRCFSTTSATTTKTITTKLFCSKVCQQTIESSAMSVSASLCLAGFQEAPPLAPAPKPPALTGDALATVIRSPRQRLHCLTASSESFDFLHVTPTGPTDIIRQSPGVNKQPSGRKRNIAPTPSAAGTHSPVVSITAVRNVSEDVIPPSFLLHGASATGRQPRVFQQSRYKLDPELFHANAINWATCFDATISPRSPTDSKRQTNLLAVVVFLSTKAVYRLSLTCRKWFDLVHNHPTTVDRVWALLLHRAWIQAEEDVQCLRELGFVSTKTKKPRRVMMKLTRQVQKTVLEGMKILLNPENWQLASTCQRDVHYLPLPYWRWQWDALHGPDHGEGTELLDRGNDLYEVITVICNCACEIVAVQARDLLRPIADDSSTMEILNGVKNGSLWKVECRRLRLFSQANRLPCSEWYMLPQVLETLEFCTIQSPHEIKMAPTTWQLKALNRLQTHMNKRLVGKDSVQPVMKWAQERHAPEQALQALEQFLAKHAPALVTNSTSGKQRV